MKHITIYSYGCKHNEPQLATIKFDRVYPCHNIVNPYTHGMMAQTGMDEEVQLLVWSDEVAKQHYRMALKDVTDRGVEVIGWECYGGRHRSVAMAEMLSESLREWPWDKPTEIITIHLSLGRY